MVVLNTPATSATATFQARQYPMIAAGDRHWALLGNGAFTKPGPYSVIVAYTPAGSASTSAPVSLQITDAKYPTESITLDPQTSTLLAPSSVNDDITRRAAVFGVYTPEKMWHGPFLRPSTAALGDTFGLARSYNGVPPTDYHRGTDFTGQTGEPVRAAAAGNVAFVGPLQVRGNSVLIDHGAGVFTGYHHLSHFDINQGATVSPGQLLGLIGSTGLVTGPHLHWEVIVRGIEVDGLDWLNGTEFGL
jgi:murein DD-endopeptidase MepM/ murein hydrolase activator NlpD